MAILLDQATHIILVEEPVTEVTIQELINAIRDWEDELPNMNCPKVADASGKEDLGGGLQVGITLKLFNWKLKFEDRTAPNYIVCTVKGGNLVAVDQYDDSMSPIEPSSYVTVTMAIAVSAALIAAAAEWSQAEKDQVFADHDSMDTEFTTVKTEIDKVQHHTGTYEPEIESLEAIRTRLDEVYAKPSGAKRFSI